MAGMDNSDYTDRSSLSGKHSSHYAALVLFQDATVSTPQQKPPVSSTGVSRDDPILQTKLPCQEVPAHNKPVVRPSLPPDMILNPEHKQAELLDMQGARTTSSKREFAISLIRRGAATEDPLIWAGVHAHGVHVCWFSTSHTQPNHGTCYSQALLEELPECPQTT